MNPSIVPVLAVPSPTTATGDTSSDKEKDKQIRSLVAALKKHKEELPEDVQQLMKEVNVRTGQEETKLCIQLYHSTEEPRKQCKKRNLQGCKCIPLGATSCPNQPSNGRTTQHNSWSRSVS